jgi:hypothetical protein
MKLQHLISYVISFVIIYSISAFSAGAQCTPMDPEQCPDPENNGQICPEIMPEGFQNQLYSEVATILVPMTDPNGIALHHFTLAAVENLPTGLAWVSNAPNNEFMAGNYYCILLEGTPEVADTFYLKIVVDVYIDVGGQAVFITQITDSTSLSMVVKESNNINENDGSIATTGVYPNPFTDQANITFLSREFEEVQLEIYSMMGQLLYTEKIPANAGKNIFPVDLDLPGKGTYCYVIRSTGNIFSGLMLKSD